MTTPYHVSASVRKTIYREMRSFMARRLKDGKKAGFCNAFYSLNYPFLISLGQLEELFDYCPFPEKENPWGGYWFDEYDHQKRIDILSEILLSMADIPDHPYEYREPKDNEK